jgi:hypothetical protein
MVSYFGMNLPTRPVRFEYDRKHAVIEQADRQIWEEAGWFVAGSATENVDSTIVCYVKMQKKTQL